MKFKTGDSVRITAGKDKGQLGKIKQVLPRLGQVIVEGKNLYRKHLKPRKTGGRGQIISQERPLTSASIALVCPHCHQPTRVSYLVDAAGQKQRFCRKCHSPLVNKTQP